VRFGVFEAMSVTIMANWDVSLCKLKQMNLLSLSSALKMEMEGSITKLHGITSYKTIILSFKHWTFETVVASAGPLLVRV
jgi:hypothetical protein